jgi:hypothetical protein
LIWRALALWWMRLSLRIRRGEKEIIRLAAVLISINGELIIGIKNPRNKYQQDMLWGKGHLVMFVSRNQTNLTSN